MADMFDKEELSIVSGLFPNTLAVANAEKQQQQNLAYERFSNAAGPRNPFGGLAGLQGMFGTAAGQDIQGVMGVQSPTTRLASLREQAAQQFDPNTPKGLSEIAQFLNQNGDSAGARQAIMLAQGQVSKAATIGKTMEETRLLGRKEIEVGVPGNPEMVQKILVDKDGNVIQKLGSPYSRFTQKTNISVDAKGETAFAEQMGKNDAKTVTAAMATRETAVNTIKSLRQLQTLNENELISGTFASGRVGVANFLNTLGLATPTEVSRIGSSQEYQKVAKDVVMQTLGGKLGSQISDADREYVEGLVAQLETSPLARKNLLKYMVDKNLDVVKESSRLESYARKNRSLEGFDYTIPRESLAPISKEKTTPSGYSQDALETEAKKRKLL
jgi:hypothetical protein